MRLPAGWEAKARPRVRSSTHSSQRLVSATCHPLQWSRSSAENSSPRARLTDYDETSARSERELSSPPPPRLGGGHCAIGLVDAVAHEPCGGSPVQGYKG